MPWNFEMTGTYANVSVALLNLAGTEPHEREAAGGTGIEWIRQMILARLNQMSAGIDQRFSLFTVRSFGWIPANLRFYRCSIWIDAVGTMSSAPGGVFLHSEGSLAAVKSGVSSLTGKTNNENSTILFQGNNVHPEQLDLGYKADFLANQAIVDGRNGDGVANVFFKYTDDFEHYQFIAQIDRYKDSSPGIVTDD